MIANAFVPDFWEPSCFEAIGNSISNFLKVNDATFSMGHSTFAHLLIDVDISLALPRDVVLMVGDSPWTQLLDYEGLPFCCRRCLSMAHLVVDCSLSRRKGVATWWKDPTEDHLTINALDFVSVDSSQDEVPLIVDEALVDVTVVVDPSASLVPALVALVPHLHSAPIACSLSVA